MHCKKKILTILITITILTTITTSGQTSPNNQTKWAKTYGGTGDDRAYSIQQTNDGGYIVAGLTNSSGAGGYDVWLLKLDASGNIEWQKAYGGTYWDWAESVQQTNDGGYIVAGCTYSFGAGRSDVWL